VGRGKIMLLIAGTVPSHDLPLINEEVEVEKDVILAGSHQLNCTQGTTAMISAALAVTRYLNLAPPRAVLAGDIGSGKGSREIYQYLINNLKDLQPSVLALHYWLPDLELMKKLYTEIEKYPKKPILIADAASMYAAKAAGIAPGFDIFTPDATEIAFLADPNASHPAYINKHLFKTDMSKAPELIEAAYRHKGAAKLLLVKGSIDYIAWENGIIATINSPDVPELECMGGTGDTITGMAAALAYAGFNADQAAIISARANRVAGELLKPNPGTRVKELIDVLPEVFKDNLCAWSGVCNYGGVK